MVRGQDGGYLYSRDGKLIPIDSTHHEYVAQHPKLFFSDDEITTLCKNYHVTELRELCHDEDFIEETGPIFEHFSMALTKKGWLKVRNIGLNSQTYITCYKFKRDYDTIMNLLTKVPDIINDNLHIEGTVDEDWITTDKSNAEKDLLERMCEAVETEERLQENRFNGEPWFSNPTAEEIKAHAEEWRKNHPEPTYFIGVVVEEDGSQYFVDKYNDLTDNYYLAKLFKTKEEAEEVASVARVCPSIVQSLEVYSNYKLKESKESFFDKLLEAIDDFPKSTHGMYRFARRRHNDTGAVRKVSGQPYWVHPEGVALIVMKHGGSDIEIKAAMAHDVLEDTGDTFEDMVEKFGYEVASIVNEITNDKDEIKRVGKEQYISDELCRISDEALTVKLADMLYNQKDSPTENNYIRMRNNVNYMLNNREDLLPIHKELAQEILDV